MHIQILEYSAFWNFLEYLKIVWEVSFYSLKRYFTIQMFRIFNFVKFLKRFYTRCTSRWLSLEYSGIEIRQFTHSAEIKQEIPFCTRKQILEYSGIEIRQFTHSAEIKREIPFCTRKRSETYIFMFSNLMSSVLHPFNISTSQNISRSKVSIS